MNWFDKSKTGKAECLSKPVAMGGSGGSIEPPKNFQSKKN